MFIKATFHSPIDSKNLGSKEMEEAEEAMEEVEEAMEEKGGLGY